MWRQTLRLVDDQHRAQSARMARLQRPSQLEQQLRLRFPLLHVEQSRNMLVKLRHGQTRVEDVSDEHRAIQTLHHPAQDRRLSRTHFAGHHHETFAAFNAIVQVGHHFRVRRSEVNEARVGSQREWQLFQTIKFSVHSLKPPVTAYPRLCIRNSKTCVSLSARASIGMLTSVAITPAASINLRRRGTARASCGVNSSGTARSTGKPV